MQFTSSESEFVGVVLSGGQSSRMGKDKSELVRQQQTMLEFTKEQLFKAGASEVVVSTRLSNAQTLNVVSDIQTNLGPLGGIYSVIKKTLDLNPSRNYLFVPVDLPFLNFMALAKMARTGINTKCHCHVSQHPLPLFLHVTDEVLATLEKAIEDKDNLSIKGFVRHFECLNIAIDNQQDWFNSNTPEQWQSALQQM